MRRHIYIPLLTSSTPISLVVHTSATPAGASALTVTSTGITTTGSNILTVQVGDFQGAAAGTLTDSKGNTWTSIASYNDGAVIRVTSWYCKNPTVGTSHTFTYTSSGICYPAIFVQGWNNASLTAPLDQQTGRGVAAATSGSAGSITPSANNCLVINFANVWTGTTPSTAGYTTLDTSTFVANTNFTCIASYVIQTTATATNPTTSWTGSVSSAHQIFSIKQ